VTLRYTRYASTQGERGKEGSDDDGNGNGNGNRRCAGKGKGNAAHG
jgi:hypothetical protein